MAAVAIPLITSAVTALLPEIPNIVRAVEGLFGPGTGDTKLPTAVSMTTAAADALATAGKISGIPDATSITTLVEAVVQQMNAAGLLGKPASTAPATVASPAASGTPLPVPSGITMGAPVSITFSGVLGGAK